MKRLAILALMLLAAGTQVAAGAPVPATGGARAELRNLVCQHALDPPARAMNITAVMRPVAGTVRMAIRFGLLQRLAGASFYTAVTGPGLNTWGPAPRGLGQRPGDTWFDKHPIADLAAPASYRYVVTFRWTGVHGKLLGTATRSSHVCWQPERRPNLVVRSIVVRSLATRPQFNEYVAVIANEGATAAGTFQVQISDGGVTQTRTIQRLRAHTSRSVAFVALACNAAAPPTVTADPGNQVDVSTRANATLAARCPTTGAPTAGG
jgi:hypothetical protein